MTRTRRGRAPATRGTSTDATTSAAVPSDHARGASLRGAARGAAATSTSAISTRATGSIRERVAPERPLAGNCSPALDTVSRHAGTTRQRKKTSSTICEPSVHRRSPGWRQEPHERRHPRVLGVLQSPDAAHAHEPHEEQPRDLLGPGQRALEEVAAHDLKAHDGRLRRHEEGGGPPEHAPRPKPIHGTARPGRCISAGRPGARRRRRAPAPAPARAPRPPPGTRPRSMSRIFIPCRESCSVAARSSRSPMARSREAASLAAA